MSVASGFWHPLASLLESLIVVSVVVGGNLYPSRELIEPRGRRQFVILGTSIVYLLKTKKKSWRHYSGLIVSK